MQGRNSFKQGMNSLLGNIPDPKNGILSLDEFPKQKQSSFASNKNRPPTTAKAGAATKACVHDINDQVDIVKKWWAEMQKEDVKEQIANGKPNANYRQELPIGRIVKKFIEWKIFQDQKSATRYLLENDADYDDDDTLKEYFDFNDFLAIFLKGIFKDVVCGIANTVQNFRRNDQKQWPIDKIQQRPLLWKLSDYKRENLFEMLKKGMVKNKRMQQSTVSRPIFENLYNLKYKADPAKWKNASYDDYLANTINKKPEVEDPYEVPLDHYNMSLRLIDQEFDQEIEYFERMKSYDIRPDVENYSELQNFFRDLINKKIELKTDEEIQEASEFQEETEYEPFKSMQEPTYAEEKADQEG